MAFVAVGLACQAADLSDDARPAIGPATIYLFLLVGGLYNVVLAESGLERWRWAGLYAFAGLALWSSGMQQAAECLDPEHSRQRAVRLGDAAILALLSALLGRAILKGAALADEQQSRAIQVALLAVGALLALRHRALPAAPAGESSAPGSDTVDGYWPRYRRRRRLGAARAGVVLVRRGGREPSVDPRRGADSSRHRATRARGALAAPSSRGRGRWVPRSRFWPRPVRGLSCWPEPSGSPRCAPRPAARRRASSARAAFVLLLAAR